MKIMRPSYEKKIRENFTPTPNIYATTPPFLSPLQPLKIDHGNFAESKSKKLVLTTAGSFERVIRRWNSGYKRQPTAPDESFLRLSPGGGVRAAAPNESFPRLRPEVRARAPRKRIRSRGEKRTPNLGKTRKKKTLKNTSFVSVAPYDE